MSFEYHDPLLRGLLSDKQTTERKYENQAQPQHALPAWMRNGVWDDGFLQREWLAITIDFTLKTPWYSRDDVPFHVLHNPVRRDRVFGRPFVAASSWKGLLRWACRMERGLYGYLERPGSRFEDWTDPPEILHLFGSHGSSSHDGEVAQRDLRAGTLAFRPTWFEDGDAGNVIGFELINPHARRTKKGTTPITYEVVPVGARGKLDLLYAPVPGQAARDGVAPAGALRLLLGASRALLERYGFSAKRTAGWGRGRITKVLLHRRDGDKLVGDMNAVLEGLSAWWEKRSA